MTTNERQGKIEREARDYRTRMLRTEALKASIAMVHSGDSVAIVIARAKKFEEYLNE